MHVDRIPIATTLKNLNRIIQQIETVATTKWYQGRVYLHLANPEELPESFHYLHLTSQHVGKSRLSSVKIGPHRRKGSMHEVAVFVTTLATAIQTLEKSHSYHKTTLLKKLDKAFTQLTERFNAKHTHSSFWHDIFTQFFFSTTYADDVEATQVQIATAKRALKDGAVGYMA